MAGNLEDVAYNRIKVAISKGYIKKGSKLKEVALSESLGMSRATVKGAVKRLVYEGLAEHEPNKGARVVNPTLEEIQETFQVRAQLEKMAVRLAADNLTAGDFTALHKLIRQEREVFNAQEQDRYYEINNAFHHRLSSRAGNHVLEHYVRELLQKTTIYLILFDPFYQLLGEGNTSPDQHEEILELLKAGEREKAADAMEAHLDSTVSGIDVERLVPDDYLTVA